MGKGGGAFCAHVVPSYGGGVQVLEFDILCVKYCYTTTKIASYFLRFCVQVQIICKIFARKNHLALIYPSLQVYKFNSMCSKILLENPYLIPCNNEVCVSTSNI